MGLFGGGKKKKNTGPFTDRKRIIATLGIVGENERMSYETHVSGRTEVTIASTSPTQIEVQPAGSSGTHVINIQSGTVKLPDYDAEFGISKLWPSKWARTEVNKMDI